MQMTLLKLCIMAYALSASVCWSASLFPDKYDKTFKEAAVLLPMGTDWRLLKAQCYQESLLQPRARSPVGAMGLCQFMPGTWKEAVRSTNVSNVWNPHQSIWAAAWYMSKLNKTWSAPRPAMDRWMLAAASYNAGAGHLIKAQRLCGGKNLYKEIVPCLPRVTGHHSKETMGYVDKIMRKWWPAMLLDY